jgi:hypothetical protein
MREHVSTVQKGNDVRAEFVGKTVTWQKAQSLAEALDNGHFASESALVAAAEVQRDIAIRAEVRKILGKPDGTLDQAQAKALTVKVGEARAREPGAVTQPKTAKGKVDRTAKDIGASLFERAIANPDWGRQAIEFGAFTQAQLDTYITAKAEVEVAKQAAAQAKAVDDRLAGTEPTPEPVPVAVEEPVTEQPKGGRRR